MVDGKHESVSRGRGYSVIEVTTRTSGDFAEFSGDVKGQYPFASGSLRGSVQESRAEVRCRERRLTARVERSHRQQCSSGPPVGELRLLRAGKLDKLASHEHAKMLEEMYVYFDMPAPAYDLQLVYNNTEYPELVTPVRDGDAVLMPSGYHPNVSVPGHAWLRTKRSKTDSLAS